MVTDAEMEAADRKGELMWRIVPHVTAAKYDERVQRIWASLSNGLEILIDPAKTEALEHASDEQMSRIELWAGGWELYFPLLDEGIWIPHALEGSLGSPRWRAAHLGDTKSDRGSATRLAA